MGARQPRIGRQRRRVGTTNGNRWLRRTLIESQPAPPARTHDSYFAAQYRQIAHRRGPNKAAVAVAHSLTDVIWHLLSTGERFEDLGVDYYRLYAWAWGRRVLRMGGVGRLGQVGLPARRRTRSR